MILEVEFALEDKSVEFVRVGTIKWVRFPEFGFGMGVTSHDNPFNSLGKSSNFTIRDCNTGSVIWSIVVHRISKC